MTSRVGRPTDNCHAPLATWLACALLVVGSSSAQVQHRSVELTLGSQADGVRVCITALQEEVFTEPGGYRALRIQAQTVDSSLSNGEREITCTLMWRPFYQREGGRSTIRFTIPRGSASTVVHATIPAAQQSNEFLSLTLQSGRKETVYDWDDLTDIQSASAHSTTPLYQILVIDRDVRVKDQVLIAGPIGQTRWRELADRGDARLAPMEAIDNLFRVSSGNYVRPTTKPLDPKDLNKCQSWYQTAKQRRENVHVNVINPADLWADWRCWAHWSMIVISAPELIALFEESPDKVRTLADWVRQGGVMVVTTDASTPPWRTVYHTAFMKPGVDPYPWESPNSTLTLGELAADWRTFYGQHFRSRTMSAFDSLIVRGGVERESREPVDVDSEWKTALQYVRLGGGMLVEVPEAEWRENIWTAMWTAMQTRSGPVSRRESEGYIQRGHEDYCAWPGVRRVPFFVIGFGITGFLLLLGPVNWLLVRRWGSRLYFMISIPGISTITILVFVLAMLAYEGVGRRSSLRSVSWLDQRNGIATSWSHQSYFSTFALPGLRYPHKSFVRPLTSSARSHHWTRAAQHDGAEESERVTSAALRARNFSWWNVGAITEADQRLVMRSSTREKLEIQNRLGVPLAAIVIRTHAGDYFAAERIEKGERRTLSRIASGATALKFVRMAFENHLRARQAFSIEELAHRRLPSRSAMLVEIESAAAVSQRGLPLGSYVAVTAQRPPFVPIGISKTRESPNTSVIIGQW